MKDNLHNVQLSDGVHLQIHSTSKFRTQTICVSFIWPLDNSKLLLSYLLSFLLFDSCAEYSDKKQVLKRMDDLYGASISVVNDPFGTTDRLRFTMSCIESFSEEEALFDEMLKTLAEFIFRPRLEHGEFPQSMFRECLQQAKIAIAEERDDPYTMTLEQANLHYGGSVAAKILPDLAEFDRVLSADCAAQWQWILDNARIDIQILGNVETEHALNCVRERFPFAGRVSDFPLRRKYHGKESFITMEKEMPQSHLVMLYETGITVRDPLLHALMLGNGLFGALPVSLLFQNIREARGLCYSIDTRILPNDGVLRAAAAAHSSKIDAVREGIEAELEKMKRGDFSDDLLDSAKRMTISGLRISEDIPSAILSSDYRRVLNPRTMTIEQRIRKYQSITKEEIAEAFANLKLCTVAVLREGGSHDL